VQSLNVDLSCKNLFCRIICIPETNALQDAVNQEIQRHRDKVLKEYELVIAPYYKKEDNYGKPTTSHPWGTLFIMALWFEEVKS